MKKQFTYLFTASSLLIASAAFAQPANDNVADAILLSVDGTTNIYTNVDATAELGEVLPSDLYWLDGETEANASIWFKFVAPADGKVTITGCDSATYVDTQFAVWNATNSADFSSYVFIAGNEDYIIDGFTACDDDNANRWSSFLELCGLIEGNTYYLQIDGYGVFDPIDNLLAEGTIGLNLSNTGICADPTELGADNICDAIELPVNGLVYIYSNTEATAEVGEVVPTITDGLGVTDWFSFDVEVQSSIWFTFEAPTTGSVEITTCNTGGTFNDTQLAVYSSTNGCDYVSFTSSSANDDAACSLSNLRSTLYACGLTPGEVYYLQVDGYGSNTGDIALSATEVPNCDATVQVVHNCADLAASTVDVYANGAILINDFAFRTATPYVTVTGGVDITLTVNLPTSVDSSNSLYSTKIRLAPYTSNLVVAQGLVSTTGYNTSVNAGLTGFFLELVNGLIESYPSVDTVAIAVVHGCTDAPTVDVETSNITLFNDLSFTGVDGYLLAGAEDLILDVTTSNGLTTVASFEAPLSLFGGQSITVFASGFLDPLTNSNGPAFGLCVATALGGPLICLDQVVGLKENSLVSGVSTYPNPTKDNLTLNFNLKNNNKVSVEIYDILGNRVFAENLGQLAAGQNKKEFQLNNFASGLYNMNLLVNGTMLTQKIQVSK